MTLLEVELTIISDSECAAQTSDSVTYTDQDTGECVTDSSSYEGRISEQMLCAGANGKDSCQASVFLPVSVPASVFGHLVFRTVFYSHLANGRHNCQGKCISSGICTCIWQVTAIITVVIIISIIITMMMILRETVAARLR